MTDPVLIVGAGPTGLTAALELSRMGVSVRLIDKREAPPRHRGGGPAGRSQNRSLPRPIEQLAFGRKGELV